MPQITELPTNSQNTSRSGIFEFEGCFDISGNDSDTSNEHFLTDSENDLQENKDLELIVEQDEYDGATSFSSLSDEMMDLYDNGKIKKRILKEGNSTCAPVHAHVTIQYKAYLEHIAEPFDSTYHRKYPLKFTLSNGEVLPGLDLAVQSMLLCEKSQFLVHPQYAYKNCTIGRIPPNSTILFEILLEGIVDSGSTLEFEHLSKEQQEEFKMVYKHALALCEKGKHLFMSGKTKDAIREFNISLGIIQDCKSISFDEDDEKIQYMNLQMRLLINLLVCYTKNAQFRKGCCIAEKIHKITYNGELYKIPTKVFFNHAKCLRHLNEYSDAKRMFKRALDQEPNNCSISKELVATEEMIQNYTVEEQKFANAFLTCHK